MKNVNFFHLNASLTMRSNGHSAVEGCAYITRSVMVDERTGTRYDFRHAHDYEYLVASDTVLPDGAPEEWHDPEILWNAAEAYSKASNARTARRIEVAYPNQLSDEEILNLTQSIADYFVSQGMCCTWAIHYNKDNSHQNKHAHFNLTTQPVKDGKFTNPTKKVYYVKNMDEEYGPEYEMTAEELKEAKSKGGKWEKMFSYKEPDGTKVRLTKTEAEKLGYTNDDRVSRNPESTKRRTVYWDTKDALKGWRRDICQMINQSLIKEKVKDDKGQQWKVDHRSYKDQGMQRRPTRHRGYKVSAIESKAAAEADSKGIPYQPVTDRAQQNMYILWHNRNQNQLEKEKKRQEDKYRKLKQTHARRQKQNLYEFNQANSDLAFMLQTLADAIDERTEKETYSLI